MQEAKGSEHDFKVYKDTIGKSVSNSIRLDADLGYLGIEDYHSNSFIPVKSSKKHQLTAREKGYNEVVGFVKNTPNNTAIQNSRKMI